MTSSRTMTLNMGPQHPSTHGVLRLVLTLDGEVVVKCVSHIGYLHTGIEKGLESKRYQQGIPLTDRMDYLAPLSNNLALVLAVCLVSLIGLPPTVGFVAKIYVFWAALQQGLLWLVLFGVLNSVISAYYYLRVVKAMYLGTPASEERLPVSKPLVAALAVAVVAVLAIGLFPQPWLDFGAGAAVVLIP